MIIHEPDFIVFLTLFFYGIGIVIMVQWRAPLVVEPVHPLVVETFAVVFPPPRKRVELVFGPTGIIADACCHNPVHEVIQIAVHRSVNRVIELLPIDADPLLETRKFCDLADPS